MQIASSATLLPADSQYHHLEAVGVIVVLLEMVSMAQQQWFVYLRLVLTVAAETPEPGQEKHNYRLFWQPVCQKIIA